MIDADLRRFIQKEIAKQMNVILSGAAGENTLITENIENLYPGMPTIEQRPIMHPYGMVSRAPRGTIQVTAKQGEHLGNRVVLGHRASDKPDVSVGEAVVYSFGKYRLFVHNGSVTVAKNGTEETLVVGETLAQALTQLITLLASHQHTGNLGYPTSAPLTGPQISAVNTNFIANQKILAKDGGRF